MVLHCWWRRLDTVVIMSLHSGYILKQHHFWRSFVVLQGTMTRHNQVVLPRQEEKPASTIREVVVFSHPDGGQSVAIVRDPSGALPESSARGSHEAAQWTLHREPAMQHPLQIVIDGGSSSQGDSLHQPTDRMSRVNVQ